jgi:hypothetical protein
MQLMQNIPDCQFDTDGFYFGPVSEQRDLSTSEYGTTITTFDYVYRQISNSEGVSLARFHEALWWKRQDLYIVRRDVDGVSLDLEARTAERERERDEARAAPAEAEGRIRLPLGKWAASVRRSTRPWRRAIQGRLGRSSVSSTGDAKREPWEGA